MSQRIVCGAPMQADMEILDRADALDVRHDTDLCTVAMTGAGATCHRRGPGPCYYADRAAEHRASYVNGRGNAGFHKNRIDVTVRTRFGTVDGEAVTWSSI